MDHSYIAFCDKCSTRDNNVDLLLHFFRSEQIDYLMWHTIRFMDNQTE